MANIPLYCKLLVKRILLLLIPYELCRVVYYICNYNYFAGLGFSKVAFYMFAGLRFDISAILFTNALFIVLSLLPFGSEEGIYRRGVLKTIYMVVNSLAFFINLGDAVFLPYVYKRSTADIFKFLGLGNDTENVMPSVIRDYWYILVIWAGVILLTYYLYKLTERKPPPGKTRNYIATSVTSYALIITLFIIGCRGGLQLKPITIIDATDYAPAHDIPLVLNSPFSILKTLFTPELSEYHFFKPDVAAKIYSPYHKASTGHFRKLNVITIILESFSKEYVGALNNRHRTNTPFLDSLISQSLVFDNAFSDGKKSIEGIPAVTASLPSWTDEPYITSDYSSDNINSLASLLGKEGYTTAFFHGGNNGTMGFTAFCRDAGFKYYYGRTQYNNDKDYDGHWGIWDEPFFQYFARNLDTLHKPFYAAIFSLSSHHPFSIPDKYKNRFVQKGNEMPILKCVRYSDMALREFIKTASHMPWYDSTLFVFVADHTGPSADPYYYNRVGMYELPIIFFMPHSNLKGRDHVTIQQIDILPTILGYLHYPEPYFSFGKDAFDSTSEHFAVNYINDVYELLKRPYALQMERQKITGLYNYETDSMLKHNLVTEKPLVKDSLGNILKAVMQTYSYDIIHNAMRIKKGG